MIYDLLMMMTSPLLVLLVVLSASNCFEEVGRCLKYRNSEAMYTIIGGDRHCIQEGEFTYCREWSCNPNCSTFDRWQGFCEPCTDGCAIGGAQIGLGKDFKCVDNANNCRCVRNNYVISTKKNASVKEMCFDELREILITPGN